MADPATKLADITQDVAPDLARTVERLERFCASQHEPPGYKETGPGIYFADVRAVLAALPKVDGGDVERVANAMREAIGSGYPYPPGGDVAECEHGKFGWEDCIACYDDFLTARLDEALASLPNQGSQVDRLAHELRERSRFPSGQPRISPEKANEIAAASVGVLTNQGEAEILREALVEARLQLEYVDSRFPTGTTPAIIARINHALAASLRTRSTAE